MSFLDNHPIEEVRSKAEWGPAIRSDGAPILLKDIPNDRIIDILTKSKRGKIYLPKNYEDYFKAELKYRAENKIKVL